MTKHSSATDDESVPTPVPVNIGKFARITGDATDAQGVRRIVIQTTAVGNNKVGYEAAELQAKQWFFSNYDEHFKAVDTSLMEAMTNEAIQEGYLSSDWLDSHHPVVSSGRKLFMFGHHVGINPIEPETTWGFEFEIRPVNSAK
jgi:hypothetical protein